MSSGLGVKRHSTTCTYLICIVCITCISTKYQRELPRINETISAFNRSTISRDPVSFVPSHQFQKIHTCRTDSYVRRGRQWYVLRIRSRVPPVNGSRSSSVCWLVPVGRDLGRRSEAGASSPRECHHSLQGFALCGPRRLSRRCWISSQKTPTACVRGAISSLNVPGLERCLASAG